MAIDKFPEFDEAFYLESYPDISAAVADGSFASGQEHYARFGRMEGRLAAPSLQNDAERAAFDEHWYRKTYTDVAAALEAGHIRSGYDHWVSAGREEGRLGPPGFGEHASGPPTLTAAYELLDRMIDTSMQSAAVRNMPFLPGSIADTPAGIVVAGYAGAPEGLTANMAFFINGRRIDQIEYPVLDTELAARFPEVQGMGFVMRGLMTQHLSELRNARVWRFDACPTGHFVEASWRQAFHFMNPSFERFPFPPPANMLRVIGDTDVARFAMGGATIFKNIERYLAELGCAWSDFPSVLDWGCGAGRVTRYLIGETPCAVTGVDIDADNIAWCGQAYSGARFATVPLRPPTDLDPESFDLVVGLSVMTHLQEKDQWKWLEELRRLTRPEALLFLSVQGPTQYAYNRFPAHLYRRVEAQGFLDLARDGALDGVVADKNYYRAAMHSRRYITQRWADYFEVVAIVDAIAGLQDFVVLRRR